MSTKQTWSLLLALLGAGFLLWAGLVRPVREAVRAERLHHVVLDVDLGPDWPLGSRAEPAVAQDIRDALRERGFTFKSSGWPQVHVTVRAFRRFQASSPNDALLGLVEMSFHTGPGSEGVLWNSARAIEELQRGPNANAEVQTAVGELVRELGVDKNLDLVRRPPSNPRALEQVASR